jgi:hypothetical protein
MASRIITSQRALKISFKILNLYIFLKGCFENLENGNTIIVFSKLTLIVPTVLRQKGSKRDWKRASSYRRKENIEQRGIEEKGSRVLYAEVSAVTPLSMRRELVGLG